MNKRLLPRINFRAYRKPRYLIACYTEWGRGAMVHCARYRREACPICQPEPSLSRAFSWNFDKCAFYCHKCQRRGDALQLVQDMLGLKTVEAAKWLEKLAGPSGSGVLLADDGRCADTRAST